MASKFKIGDRVRHIGIGYHGTIVGEEGRGHVVPVRYDGDDTLWHTPSFRLEKLKTDESGERFEPLAGAALWAALEK